MAQGEKRISNLLKSAGINENPSKLNDLGRILGHIDTVFIASGRNVDHDVAVDVELGHLLRSHDGDGSAGSRQLAFAGCRQRLSTLKRSPGRSQWLVVKVESMKTRSGSLRPQPARRVDGRREIRAMEVVTGGYSHSKQGFRRRGEQKETAVEKKPGAPSR